jgi:hypothetical protein
VKGWGILESWIGVHKTFYDALQITVSSYKIKCIGFHFRRVCLHFAFKTAACPQLLRKTDWTVFKIMDGSFFLKPKRNRFSVFRTPLINASEARRSSIVVAISEQ